MQVQHVSAVRLRVVPHSDTTSFRNFKNAVFYFGTVTKGLVSLSSESSIVASATDMISIDSSHVRVSSDASLEAFSTNFTVTSADLSVSAQDKLSVIAGTAELEAVDSLKVFAGDNVTSTTGDYFVHAFESIETLSGKSVSLGTEYTDLTTSAHTNVSTKSVKLLADTRLDLSAGEAISVNTTDMQLGIGDKFGFVVGKSINVETSKLDVRVADSIYAATTDVALELDGTAAVSVAKDVVASGRSFSVEVSEPVVRRCDRETASQGVIPHPPLLLSGSWHIIV